MITKENTAYLPQRVRIIQDTDPESPREWGNVGRMVCWHRRYNLGDEQPGGSPREWLRQLAADQVGADDPDAIPDEHIQRILEKHFVILPLYLYDHSGITISCAPFSCPWDSGQVGYIYCTKKVARNGCGSVTNAEKYLRQEVETYNQYLTGDVYGFVVEALDYETGEWEHLDSCWGFYGHNPRENGMADHLGDEALIKSACNAEIEFPH